MAQTPKDNASWRPNKRTWLARFAGAIRGIGQGMAGQPSFVVHGIAATGVLVLAGMLSLSAERWCLLILCVGAVLAAELFNSSLEWIGRSITDKHDTRIGRALDIASGAVLVVALTAATVGCLILIPELPNLWRS